MSWADLEGTGIVSGTIDITKVAIQNLFEIHRMLHLSKEFME